MLHVSWKTLVQSSKITLLICHMVWGRERFEVNKFNKMFSLEKCDTDITLYIQKVISKSTRMKQKANRSG